MDGSAAVAIGAYSAPERPSVVLVHDEPLVVRALVHSLETEGWEVSCVRSSDDALRAVRDRQPDLFISAAHLRTQSGIDLARTVRERSAVPIVLVSADDNEVDAVVALETAADGYVMLPCGRRELAARLRAIVRRCRWTPPPVIEESPTVFRVGDVTVDTDKHEVVVRGEARTIPRKQFALLLLLARHQNRALRRDFVMREVWGDDYIGDTRTLESHIKRLRAVIETDPAEPERILTVRGIGYKLVASREPVALVR